MSLSALPRAVLLASTLLLGACRDDSLAALEQAADRLQENLDDKAAGSALEQLHPQFRARGDLDRDWAGRTMALLFLRHRQVKVLTVGRSCELDSTYSTRGHCRAQVALAGAQSLVPDSARLYSVRSEWWLEDGDWQLARLDWE